MSRTALVTGGTGFIATHLVPALTGSGWEVRTCGRRPRPDWLASEVDYRRVDLTGDDDLATLVDGVDSVFHLAGASSSSSSDEEMQRDNVEATGNLVEAALGEGVARFLHVSSSSVYGEEVELPSPVVEDVEPVPSRGYGKAKWGAEQAVWRGGKDGLATVVLRPVSVYGPGNTKLLGSAILDAAIERFAGQATLLVHDQPVELRLLHVDDLVSACLHLVDHPDATGRAFNLTMPTYPSSHEVAGLIAQELHMELALGPDPDCGLDHAQRQGAHARMLEAGMVDAILLSPERFRMLRKTNRNNRLSVDALLGTGFTFGRTDLAAGVAATVGWYQDHRWII